MFGLAAMALVLVGPAPITVPIAEAVAVDAGATCLEAPKLHGAVAMWLDRQEVAAAITVRVVGDPVDAHGVSFVIARDGRDTTPRSMRGLPADCAATHAAVGLAIAVAIDATVLDEIIPRDPQALAPEPRVPASTPHRSEVHAPTSPQTADSRPPVRTPGPPPARVGVHARVGARLGGGLVPGVAYGFDLGLGIGFRRPLDLEVGGGALWGPHGELAGDRFRSTLGHADVRICGRLDSARVTVRACAAFGAGAMRVVGVTYAMPLDSTVPWVALGPAFELVVPNRQRVAFAARIDVWIPLVRTDVVGLGDTGPVAVNRVAPVGAALTLGPWFRVR